MVRYSKEDILEKEDIDNLIKSCKNLKEKFIIITLIYTGMRVSEFCNIKKSWVRWQENKIVVPSIQGVWQPKTSSGSREIPLVNDKIREVLREWFEKYSLDEFKMSRIGIFKMIKTIAKRANIMKNVYPHSLRATFASMLAVKNISPASLQAIMGWKGFATAERYVRSTRALDEVKEKWK